MGDSFKTIILASSRDFRGGDLTSSLATCLWPVLGTSVIERLLSGLYRQGVSEAVVCSNGCGPAIEATIDKSECPELTFLDEPFPIGSAGCIRAAASDEPDESLLVVFQGSMVLPPEIDELLSAHKELDSDMTVFINPDGQGTQSNGNNLQAAGIYVLFASVLKHIPAEGYFDIKESLIPELLAAGKKVAHATVSENVNVFRDHKEYIHAVASVFSSPCQNGLKCFNGSTDVWVGEDVEIAADARFVGPVAVLDGAKIHSRAVVIGPAVIGENSIIGSGSILVKSILWKSVKVGHDCRITGSIVADNMIIDDQSDIVDTAQATKSCGHLEGVIKKLLKEQVSKCKIRKS